MHTYLMHTHTHITHLTHLTLYMLITCTLSCAKPSASNHTTNQQKTPTKNTQTKHNATPDTTPKKDPTHAAPLVPFEGGALKPALSQMAKGESFDAKVFYDTQTCATCHQEIVTQHNESMHSFASLNNNIYLASFEDFLHQKGKDKTRFCAGCHDIAVLFDDEVQPSTSPTHISAHTGVTCTTCHGIIEANTHGNGSYTLTTKPIPIPHQNKPNEAATLAAHRKRLASPVLRTNTLCVSCHRGFLSPESGHDVVLTGLDEWGPWRGSAFNKDDVTRIDMVEEQNCVSCHMPKEQGLPSHRFPGGHTTFAQMIQSPAQLEANRKLIIGSASLDLFERAKKKEMLTIDVLVFNERVGHNFPGGAKDLKDTWMELALYDAQGKIVAQEGQEHEKNPVPTNAHVFQVRLASNQGKTQNEHNVSHFRAPVFDHSIAPRDGVVIRYTWNIPKGFDAKRLPLTATATLKHRRLTPGILKRACHDSKTKRGKEFKKYAKKFKGIAPDPCITQPVLIIDKRSFVLGKGIKTIRAHVPEWERRYRYATGLLKQVQENLEEAKAAFESALDVLPQSASPHHHAKIMVGLARVQGRLGRTKEAVTTLKAAKNLVPNASSIDYWLGEAYMRVWRFEEAAHAFDAVSKPNTRVWERLAIAQGSASKPLLALQAAHKGLNIEPRHSHMLRSQMLAYRNLDVPQSWIDKSAKAFEKYKRDEQAPHIRDVCSQSSSECRRERLPIHTHILKTVK